MGLVAWGERRRRHGLPLTPSVIFAIRGFRMLKLVGLLLASAGAYWMFRKRRPVLDAGAEPGYATDSPTVAAMPPAKDFQSPARSVADYPGSQSTG
jgi:hypothetical protein